LCTFRSFHKTKSVNGFALRNFATYSRSSNTKNIKLALSKGWINFDVKGDKYYFKSLRKIAEDYSVTITRFKEFRGDTYIELIARAACNYLAHNIAQQHIKEGNYVREDTAKKKSMSNRCLNKNVVYSTRSLCKLVGYNSTFAATRLFREAERLGLIKRKRQYKHLGDVLTVGFDYATCFVVLGQVYARMTSSICIA
jgi:hypothetical protein